MATTTTTTSKHVPAPATFRRGLRAWYAEHGRHGLPWRLTRDPYAVLVSEVMLQQTQVERVIPYYKAWLERWPTAEALGGASRAEVIRAWAGLGYNSRAVRLHEAARMAVERHGGIPVDEEVLRALPGIGAYTAAAVASFAGERAAVVIDTNIGRVVARARLGVAGIGGVSAGVIQGAAAELTPKRGIRDHGLAMMDLGAMVCRAKTPVCGGCPVRRGCAWRVAGYPESEARPRKPTQRFEETARFARGRIVEALRGGPLEEAAIGALLPGEHRARAGAYLAALVADGLVEARGEGYALAGEGDSSSMASPNE